MHFFKVMDDCDYIVQNYA